MWTPPSMAPFQASPVKSSQVRSQLAPGLKCGWLLMTEDGHWGLKRMPQSRSTHPRPLASTMFHGETPVLHKEQ